MARSPMRPTARACPAPATPATSDEKISGAMIILISRRKIPLKGANKCARAGAYFDTSAPAMMPSRRPARICRVSVKPRALAIGTRLSHARITGRQRVGHARGIDDELGAQQRFGFDDQLLTFVALDHATEDE